MILSIHQPRYTIFKMFDRLSLLEAGHCVFHGQESQALPFFESLGLLHNVFIARRYCSELYMLSYGSTENARHETAA